MTEECRNNIFADTSKFNDSFDSVRGLGGIDGISYAGIAYAVSLNELAEKAKTPNLFKKVTVKFSIDGKITEVFEVPCGGRIADLPQIGNEQGKYWRWDDFGADCVTFSQTVSGEWHRMITTIATNEEIPQILVEGIFDDEAYVVAEDAEEFALKNGFGEGVPTAAFRVRVFGAEAGESTYTVRCLSEEDCRLSVLTDAGWNECEFKRDGKYIVFELNNNGIFAIEKVIKKGPYTLYHDRMRCDYTDCGLCGGYCGETQARQKQGGVKQSQPSERFGMGGDNGSKKCRMPFERKRMIKFIEKTPITQGWSDDYKYFALGADGKKYLLRVTPGKINPDFITLFEAQKKCASIISAAENIPMQQVPMSIPIECGMLDDIHAFCDDIRQHTEGAYAVYAWADGGAAEPAVAVMPAAEQYAFGLRAGRVLKYIHEVPAPDNVQNWEKRINVSIENKLRLCRECSIKNDVADSFVEYIKRIGIC